MPHASSISVPLIWLHENYSLCSANRDTFITQLFPVSFYTLLVIPNFVFSTLLSNILNLYSFLNTPWFKIKIPAKYFHVSYILTLNRNCLHLTLVYTFLGWRLNVYCGIGSRFVHIGCMKLISYIKGEESVKLF